MKKSITILFSLLAIFILLSFTGCPTPSAKEAKKDKAPEFSGVWIMTASGLSTGTDRLAFTGTSLFQETNISSSLGGSMIGTITLNIISYDQVLNHIQGTVTSATGTYASVTGTLYITYSISGSILYFNYNPFSYPATVPNGPYVKQ